ncbi:MAG: HmuY family protein [Calditrichae bacterium]|nr:HmuY family protein [Calditrichota bacterium]MCB9058360.1 HmuY family protein [Calditrichia bacterium]
MRFTLILMMLMFTFWACSDNSTGSDNNDNQGEAQTFQSGNVKTEGTQYFTFSTNSGSATEPASWDIAFSAIPFPVEISDCNFLTIPDPAIILGEGVAMAKVEAASLDAVTDIPAAEMFMEDITEGTPFVGKNWYDASFEINPDVYVVRTCGGATAVLDIKRYDYDFMVHQITNIVVEYKYNADGSMDFSSTTVDSFATGDANSEPKYISLSNGVVTADDVYDLKVDGTSIWLGNSVAVKKIAGSDLASTNTVTDADWESDITPSYVGSDWYDYGEGHLLTPSDFVYVVKTIDGKYAAFEITNYYDNEGNSGVFTIDWNYLQ